MPASRLPQLMFRASLFGATLLSAGSAAYAGDKPATPEGAAKLTQVLQTYLGKTAVGGAAPISVKADGSAYDVSVDLSAAATPMKAQGFSYDPAVLTYKLVEQDDGLWRIAMDSFPKISGKSPEATVAISADNFKHEMIFDPAIAWVRSGTTGADKATIEVHSPKVDEVINLGPVKATVATTTAADGSVATNIKEELNNITLKLTGSGDQPDKKVNIDAQVDKGWATIDADGVKSRQALDLWAFLVAHPGRADLAAHEAELKALIVPLFSGTFKFHEAFGGDKINVASPAGPVLLASSLFGFGVSTNGQKGAVNYHLKAEGVSLPAGAVPPMYKDLAPTTLDIGFWIAGFDVAAALNEALADMHLQGDGPVISDEDQKKIGLMLVSSGSLAINIAPSHIVAPALDLTLEGKVHVVGMKPTGSVTIHMKDFDKTMAAAKALGPDMERQAAPVIAMAKGLAKTDPDGTLTWIAEAGADGSIKVNGLPLGKLPF